MKDRVRNDLLLLLTKYVSDDELRLLSAGIDIILTKYDVSLHKNEIIPYEYGIPATIETYLMVKRVEGKSDKTRYLYGIVLRDFFETVQKKNEEITANDIRGYLYQYQRMHGISNRTLDCKRTIICTYFKWLAAENIIQRDPSTNISPIKYEKKHKKAMSQLELEKMRLACKTKREKAIIEMLYSTGCRVSELENLNISDVNFQTKEVYLFGKGNKHRTSYMNAKAQIALNEYLNERKDNNVALFVNLRSPHNRLKKASIEMIIRNILQRTDLSINVTPHIFRHTMCTQSLEHGMSVVEVSRLLGHCKLETTMEYISIDDNSIKNNFNRCVV